MNVIIAQNSLPAVAAITDHSSNPIGVYLTSINQIRVLIEKLKPNKVILALDGPEAGERRRQIYPEYKRGSRVKARVSKVQIMEGEDNIVYGVEGAYQNQLIKIYEMVKLLPVTLTIVPYAEGDDIIAHLVTVNSDKENIIVSNDKDYLQMINENTFVYRWREKKLYGEKDIKETYNILAKNFIYRKVVLGDTSDFIPGIEGVGEKTFKVFEPLLLSKVFSNIEEFYSEVKNISLEGLGKREKTAIETVMSQKDKLELAYKLMKLSSDSLLEEQKKILQLQIEEQKEKKFSRFTTELKMQKNSFNKLYNGFSSSKWIEPFYLLKNNLDINS